jgi:hypothetical protein
MDRLESSALGLQDGVENDLEKEDVTDARLCLRSARRSMIRLQGVEGVEVEGKIFDGWMDRWMDECTSSPKFPVIVAASWTLAKLTKLGIASVLNLLTQL